ncbi:hypothetical protein E2C01_040211 [Portunus trituberculatus]|uniref:Uncharacterized protein n=1 Tax=Portunus trituberculatus TaxID=210409 RepID=A0A5B7FGT1_PORTR|nr:hypothetical protein [Portunus trituberculatus]
MYTLGRNTVNVPSCETVHCIVTDSHTRHQHHEWQESPRHTAYPHCSPLYFLAPEYTNQPLLVFLYEPTYLRDD